ncbi:hypothetical protein [Halomarina oriensis]|uniref:DUF4239 domain-containing protein n=1 Tax=Halomarina oriensis TaxID=671145 RepID=A0A6B0GGM7_9EURY|nr:hypothetical protein [Halomarina oriensis]MWG34002.1 hypothetical protein [Halomarina oriensis]
MSEGDDSSDDGTVSKQSDVSTENTMRARAGESRIKLWVLLGANRLFVTGVLCAIIFVGFILFGITLNPPFYTRVAEGDVLGTIFSTMTSALITGVTLVVSINQLVISQENGPLGDQHTRMSNTLDFRTYTSELIGSVTPADPSAFLSTIVETSEKRAERLREAVDGCDNDQFIDEVDEFVGSLTENADTVKGKLDGATFGTFDVLFAALDYNYSYKVFQVERLRELYSDDVDENTEAALDDLHTSLVMFGPAREHIKTLYFQWALTSLSQLIVYAAIPALLVSGAMLAFVDGATFTGTTAGVSDILWITSGAFTVALVPFFLFVSYVMRIATVAKRTLAIGPLILRDSQR